VGLLLRRATVEARLLDLETTLNSGQTFLWRFHHGGWCRVIKGTPVMLRQRGLELDILLGQGELTHDDVIRYLGLNDDLEAIYKHIEKDAIISRAIGAYRGLRILRQDPWECLITFLCATNTSMKNIELMLGRLAIQLGSRHEIDGVILYGLPSHEAVVKSSKHVLTRCGLGYRAEAVIRAARAVHKGDFDLEAIRTMSYDSAHKMLAGESQVDPHMYGVGPKVADCILLFAFEMLEAFPIDVWIARTVKRYYSAILPEGAARALLRQIDGAGRLTRTQYREISGAMRSYFGRYAGQAQQQLYVASRSRVI